MRSSQTIPETNQQLPKPVFTFSQFSFFQIYDMVRHYKKKKPHRYDEQGLLQAVEAVTKDGLSLKKAARNFNIPFGTIRNHVLHPNMKIGGGVSTVLSAEEEDHLAHALVYLSRVLAASRPSRTQADGGFLHALSWTSQPFQG